LVAAEAARPLRAAEAERRRKTEQFAVWTGRFFPPLAFQQAIDVVAGASAGRLAEFEKYVVQLEDRWHAFFAPRIMMLREMTAEDFNDIPHAGAFDKAHGLREAVWPSSMLLGMAVVLSAVFWRSSVYLRK
jgi:hypothetical protein